MMSFPFPVVAYNPNIRPHIGPGSQPEDDEVVLQTLDVPRDVHTFRPPPTELDAPPEVLAAALDFLRTLLAALRATPFGAPAPVRFSLAELAPAVRDEINALLGEGEVSVMSGQMSGGALRAQETAFTGIWRVRSAEFDYVEASAFPHALIELARAIPMPTPDAADHAPPPPELMNAPALYAEIRAHAQHHRAGDAAHVINLSLLPATPEDLAWLDARLGRAGISILSRGFGNCRITATALPQVWWVQYFNAMEKLILNSIEVDVVPAVALAAQEDYGETIARLDEWIVSLASAT